MHKITSCARFITVAKKCIDKQISTHVKLYYKQIDAYHKEVYYFHGTKAFWVIQNIYLPLECINTINKRENAKQNKYI